MEISFSQLPNFPISTPDCHYSKARNPRLPIKAGSSKMTQDYDLHLRVVLTGEDSCLLPGNDNFSGEICAGALGEAKNLAS